jgi:hypothetical protein
MGWKSKAKYVVVSAVPGAPAITYVYDRFGNVVTEAIGDAATDLKDEAFDLGADLVDDISEIAFDVANATLDLIEGAGLAFISGAELMYDYGYNKVAPYRVETITAITAMVVYITTAVIIGKKIAGAK